MQERCKTYLLKPKSVLHCSWGVPESNPTIIPRSIASVPLPSIFTSLFFTEPLFPTRPLCARYTRLETSSGELYAA